MTAPPTRAVYGGGGFFGIAYGLGVAHGLREAGIDLTDAPALGTSAGVWVASSLVRGVDYDNFDALAVPAVPELRPGHLADLARTLFGPGDHPNVSAVVVGTNGRRRVLHGTRTSLADLCAASSAVPGVFAPHQVGGRTYVDGGVRSGASVDLAGPADHLVAVVPLGHAMFAGGGRALDVALGREVAAWKQRNPNAALTVIRPNRAIASVAGLSPANLFDAGRAKRVYPLAVDQGRRWADRIQRKAAA